MTEVAETTARQANSISVPAFEQKMNLNTLQAQKVMSRVFARASDSLYRIDVILRIIGKEEHAQQVEEVIKAMFDEVETGLKNSAAQNAALLEENGIEDMPSYDAPYSERIRVTSPQVARFAAMVRRLDKLVMEIDALWLTGIIDNGHRNEAAYRWQQRIIGLGSRIIGIERRARLAAKRQGKGDEVDAAAPFVEEKDDVAEDSADSNRVNGVTENITEGHQASAQASA